MKLILPSTFFLCIAIIYLLNNSLIDISKQISSSYLKLQKKKKTTGHGEPRVVFYEARNDIGYGNRMYPLLSAFMAAVLLDSALLINWPDLNKYYDSNLTNVFTNFTDKSFLDPNQKEPKICNIIARSPDSYIQVKRIEVFNSKKLIS